MKDSQKVVNYFLTSLNKKCTGTLYKQWLGIANSLLKVYSLEEVFGVIDYIVIKKMQDKVKSLAYLQYIANESIVYFKHQKAKEKVQQVQKCSENTEVTNIKPKVKQGKFLKNFGLELFDDVK